MRLFKKSQERHIIILIILGLLALVVMAIFIWKSGGNLSFYLGKLFS